MFTQGVGAGKCQQVNDCCAINLMVGQGGKLSYGFHIYMNDLNFVPFILQWGVC